MRVINIGVHTVQKYQNPMCACIGYFDGMHLGHQALVKATVELAQKHDCESALIPSLQISLVLFDHFLHLIY